MRPGHVKPVTCGGARLGARLPGPAGRGGRGLRGGGPAEAHCGDGEGGRGLVGPGRAGQAAAAELSLCLSFRCR